VSTVLPSVPMLTTTTNLEPSLQQIQEQLAQFSRALQLVTDSREAQGHQQLVAEPVHAVAGLPKPTIVNLLQSARDPEVLEVCHIY
jgi:hypothetical protein